MMVVLAEHADTVSEALTIVMLAGLMQVALGILRIGRFITYTPYSMIAGFTSGIGVIIIIIQTLPFLGAAPEPGGLFGIFRAWPSGGVGGQPSRGRRRADVAGDLRALAPTTGAVRARTPASAGDRNRNGSVLAERRSGDWHAPAGSSRRCIFRSRH